jgi:RNA ligase (TIGR02306 family)
MSTFSVTAEKLIILPHPNADALELAVVGGYHAVVRKGQYRSGDVAVYIPEQAIVPDSLLEELGLVGRLAGSKKNRIKTVRLRGEVSQGIVCSPAALSSADLLAALEAGQDLSEVLGIVKWFPKVPTSFGGILVAVPDLHPWISIENIQRYPTIFAAGELVEATEKIHGIACAITLVDGELFVSSRGYSAKRLAIVENPDNIYWRAVRAHSLDVLCKEIAADLGASSVGLFGEVYGSGVQDLTYGLRNNAAPGYACFDVFIVPEGAHRGRWLERSELAALCQDRCQVVPVLYEGPYDYEALHALAEGSESLSGHASHLREGIVIRAVSERYSPVTGNRAIAKLVSAGYLLRHGGTEYE